MFGFERSEEFVEQSSGKHQAWILFRYSKSEIQKEKTRLSASRATVELNKSGPSDCEPKYNGSLVITSSAPNARVKVDDEVVGRTPAKLSCQFEVGKELSILIDHPKFENYETKVIITPGQSTTVSAVLKAATVRLSVETNPSNAKAYLNSEFVGVTPIVFQVLAGERLQLLFDHPEAEKLATEIEVPKSKAYSRSFDLKLKPGFFKVQAAPTDSEVVVDGQGPYKAGSLIPCVPGQRSVQVSKQGFESKWVELTCIGNRTANLDKVTLSPTPLEQVSSPSEDSAWRLSLGIGTQGLPIGEDSQRDHISSFGGGWALAIDYKLFSRFWIGIGGAAFSFSKDDKSKSTGQANSTGFLNSNLSTTILQTRLSYQAWQSIGLYTEYGQSGTTLNQDGYDFNSSGSGTLNGSSRTITLGTQPMFGAGLTYRSSNDGWGFQTALGARSFSDSSGAKGSTTFYLEFGGSYGW